MNAPQPLWLDYQRPLPRQQWLGFLFLSASLLLCGFLLAESLSLSSELADTEQQIFKLKRQAERKRLFSAAEQPFANAPSADLRTLPPSAARWESLLGALENAADDSITLLALEPSSRETRITGEAKDIGASLNYAKRLQSAPVFADVYLVKHEIIREHPYRPVRFALLAQWREILP